jgi:hypothetical protein
MEHHHSGEAWTRAKILDAMDDAQRRSWNKALEEVLKAAKRQPVKI